MELRLLYAAAAVAVAVEMERLGPALPLVGCWNNGRSTSAAPPAAPYHNAPIQVCAEVCIYACMRAHKMRTHTRTHERTKERTNERTAVSWGKWIGLEPPMTHAVAGVPGLASQSPRKNERQRAPWHCRTPGDERWCFCWRQARYQTQEASCELPYSTGRRARALGVRVTCTVSDRAWRWPGAADLAREERPLNHARGGGEREGFSLNLETARGARWTSVTLGAITPHPCCLVSGWALAAAGGA